MAKQRKNNNIKRARAGVRGLIIEWSDKHPLRETQAKISGKISHKNPLFKLCANKIFADYGDWITTQQPFHWLITITVVFIYPNGQEQHETRELEAFTKLTRINEHSLEAIQCAMRHGNMQHYSTTQFKIECLDTADRRNKKQAA